MISKGCMAHVNHGFGLQNWLVIFNGWWTEVHSSVFLVFTRFIPVDKKLTGWSHPQSNITLGICFSQQKWKMPGIMSTTPYNPKTQVSLVVSCPNLWVEPPFSSESFYISLLRSSLESCLVSDFMLGDTFGQTWTRVTHRKPSWVSHTRYPQTKALLRYCWSPSSWNGWLSWVCICSVILALYLIQATTWLNLPIHWMAAKEEPNMPYEDLAPSYADEAVPEDDGST